MLRSVCSVGMLCGGNGCVTAFFPHHFVWQFNCAIVYSANDGVQRFASAEVSRVVTGSEWNAKFGAIEMCRRAFKTVQIKAAPCP